MTLKPLKEKGNCDACPYSIDVVLYELHGMKLCDGCVKSEEDAVTKAIEANVMVKESREVDATIEIKMDVFNAETVAIQQVMASIQHDEAIPAADKNFAMARHCMNHFKSMQAAIFEEKAAFAEKMRAKENQMRAWQVQVHTFAAQVEGAKKEVFKNFDISYQPAKPKVFKPTKAPNSYKKPTKHELADAAIKFKLPMVAIMMAATARNLSAEGAAKFLMEQMSKKS